MPITAEEQYAIELINRARLDPAAEAARQKIALNSGLAAGTISDAVKQVLAPHNALDASAEGHAAWMLLKGVFSHTGANGSTPGDRMAAAGYSFTGSWGWGENIALRTVSGMSLQKVIEAQLNDLYASPTHRANLFGTDHREIGLAQVVGSYLNYGQSSALVENFAHRATVAYVTGVIYQDRNADDFYSIGEGVAGTALSLAGGARGTTAAAGGYALTAQAGAKVTLTIGTQASLIVDLADGNVKVDLVSGNELHVSGDVDLLSGVGTVVALGGGNLAISGHGGANRLVGNSGANQISGESGRDLLLGGAGADLLQGGNGTDTLRGEAGNDRLIGGEHADRLEGGAGADKFVFTRLSERDTVVDFDKAEGDRLQLDNVLWTGTLTTNQVVARHTTLTDAGVEFDFGSGDVLVLAGVQSLTGLAGVIDLI